MTAIYGNSKWTRDAVKALTPDDLAKIDAVLPDNTFVTVGAERSPGVWSVRLMGSEGQIDMVKPAYDLVAAVQTLAMRYAEGSR